MPFELISISLAAVLGIASQGQAPNRYTQYGTKTERGSTRVAYWDDVKNEAVGQAAIDYGRPVWKEAYDEGLHDMTRGKIWRLGENFWTSLDTSLPLTVSGVEVPVGYYYLAVERSEDGSDWELLFLDPASARAKWVDPFEVATRPAVLTVLYRARLAFERRAGEERAEKLDIELSEERLVLAWGSFALTAPVAVKGP